MANVTTSELRKSLWFEFEYQMLASAGKARYGMSVDKADIELAVDSILAKLKGEEFCVMHYRYPAEPHRGPYATLEEAQSWIDEAEDDGFPAGVFYVASRHLTAWEKE